MSTAPDLDSLLDEGIELRSTASGVASSVGAEDEGAPYDRHARFYDRLVGSPIYNRVLWRADARDYTAFAREAFAAGERPFLDAGCGTAVFTAEVYRADPRELVLVDRSVGMLTKAIDRVGGARHAAPLQADLEFLPTRPGAVGTIGCFAMLHVLDRPWDALAALAAQLETGGLLFASMLVLGAGRVPDGYLQALRRAGELGPLRTSAEFEAAARAQFATVAVERRGAMAYLRAAR